MRCRSRTRTIAKLRTPAQAPVRVSSMPSLIRQVSALAGILLAVIVSARTTGRTIRHGDPMTLRLNLLRRCTPSHPWRSAPRPHRADARCAGMTWSSSAPAAPSTRASTCRPRSTSIDAARIRDGPAARKRLGGAGRGAGPGRHEPPELCAGRADLVRGFGARSTFGVRGVRLYHRRHSGDDAGWPRPGLHFNLDSAERIEVLRGPFSALYGNQSGGVIQLFTRDRARHTLRSR